MTSEAGPSFWDAEADRFDEEPDHGLRSPATVEAWRALLVGVLPEPPARVADLGCGTGSLGVLLAGVGYPVDGVDFSPVMVARARAKASSAGLGERLAVLVGDAAAPPLPDGRYDVVLARHVTWALPDPDRAMARWRDLLKPGGHLVLVEGFWSTGAGLHADELTQIVATAFGDLQVRPLTDPALWGRPITDERYLLTARRPERSELKD